MIELRPYVAEPIRPRLIRSHVFDDFELHRDYTAQTSIGDSRIDIASEIQDRVSRIIRHE